MSFRTNHLRSAVVDAIAELMAAAGDDHAERREVALARFANCPESLLREADLRADELVEEQFLLPLAGQFADQVAAREREAAADRERRLPSMSSGHLDRDIPF